MSTFIVDGEEFARAAYNALAFTPARSSVPAAMFYVGSETYLLATDTYAIGRPSLGSTPGAGRPLGLELTRADLTSLDKLGRACKGELKISIPEDRGLIASGIQTPVQEVIPNRSASLNYDRTVWDLCHSLLDGLEAEQTGKPDTLALDPALLSRFGKIKTPKGTSPLLDIKIVAYNEPILIKCGPRFTGALMPVDRAVARNSATRGNQFLW